jgi:CCR4-NOT transcriptional regulation complex NOT5 subunit
MTTTDKTNRAFLEDMRQRKKGGAYAPPVYYIERQFNCNIAATATGNQGSTSALASSPSTSGNVTQAKANDSQNRFDTASAFDLFGFPSSAGAINDPRAPTANDPRTANGLTSTSDQSNTGMVTASTNGDVKTTLTQNQSEQVINSNQNSSAPQTASVGNSTACSFGVLN